MRGVSTVLGGMYESSRDRGELVARGGVRARHRSSVDDGVRVAARREALGADRGVDRERGIGASHEEADHAPPARAR